MQSYDTFGVVNVVRTGTRRGFRWVLEFMTLRGDQPELTVSIYFEGWYWFRFLG